MRYEIESLPTNGGSACVSTMAYRNRQIPIYCGNKAIIASATH